MERDKSASPKGGNSDEQPNSQYNNRTNRLSRRRLHRGSDAFGDFEKGLTAADRIFVTNRNNAVRLEQLTDAYGVNATTDKLAVARASDILILAIKPKDAGKRYSNCAEPSLRTN